MFARRFSSLVVLMLAAVAVAGWATLGQAAVTVIDGSGFSFTGNAPAGSTVPADPVDIALAANGSTPFGTTPYGGVHTVPHINDGTYGNSYSWLGASGQTIVLGGSYGTVNMAFAGVALPSYSSTLYTLTGFTFGRSNLNEYGDRIAGTMYVQYAAAASADLTNTSSTYDSLWTTIGALTTTDVYDHVFSFNTPINAAGLRIVTAAGNCIDEIAVYGSVYVPGPVWNGGGTPSPTYDWNDNFNWAANAAPVNGDVVTFDGINNTTTNNNISGLELKDIVFSGTAGAFINGGNSVKLTGGITNNSTSLQTINHHIGLTGTEATQTIKTVAGDILINGNISDGDLSAHGIVKDGAQTLTLAGANNTYSGPTTVTAGTLIVTGKLASAVGVNNGGRLVGSSGTLNGLVTANSGGVGQRHRHFRGRRQRAQRRQGEPRYGHHRRHAGDQHLEPRQRQHPQLQYRQYRQPRPNRGECIRRTDAQRRRLQPLSGRQQHQPVRRLRHLRSPGL